MNITLDFNMTPATLAETFTRLIPEIKMDDRVLAIVQGRTNLYPTNLEQRFSRILNRIIELWESPEIENYFTDLLIDNRGGTRQGFPPEVASEIFALSQVSEKLRAQSRAAPVASDPWQDTDNPKRVAIEEIGYEFSPQGFVSSAEKGDPQAIRLFIELGVDVNACDERGLTPLMASSFNGNEEIALLLIRSGADVHATDTAGYGSLHWAAFNGYYRIAKILLEQHADVNARSQHGWTPLLQAATRGHLLACAQLLAGKADINLASNDGWTALHKAAANGHTEVVKLLLAKGARRDVEYQNGTTPLDLAIKNKHEAIVALLNAAQPQPAPLADAG